MSIEKISQARPNAWLLDFGGSCRAAVGTRVLLHLIDHPKTIVVPYTPAYCRRVVLWQDRFLPVMDMAARLGAAPQEAQLLAVAGYQEQPGAETRFGAFLLAASPIPVVVDDAQACTLPEQPSGWEQLAVSCFDYQGAPVPVLHMGRIFSSLPQASE